MAVNVRDTMTTDGKRLEKLLKELGQMEVRIGIQEMSSDGQGKYDGEKIFAKGGTRDETGKIVDSDVSLIDIAMYNELGTEHIPSRPFLRDSVDANENKINRFLKSMQQEILHGSSAEEVLKKIGTFQKGLIQEQIVKGSFAPNAESTVRKKGSNKPLVDTGRMRQSVNYVIQKKGSGDN